MESHHFTDPFNNGKNSDAENPQDSAEDYSSDSLLPNTNDSIVADPAGDSKSDTIQNHPQNRKQLNGERFDILEELGIGGMGIVRKAWDRVLNRIVALKSVRLDRVGKVSALTRFRKEANVLAKLNHSHIVQIHDWFEDGEDIFIVMEFVEGKSLAQIEARESQNPIHAARLVRTLSQAMQFAHDQRIIHRDLKPANILLTPSGEPKITDFGLAKEVSSNVRQTQTGTVMGTPSYMSPEQAGGSQQGVGPHSDLYALGAILYELLTGRPPFQGGTAPEILLQVQTATPVPPKRLQPSVPKDLETICLKCLRKEPDKRYRSAKELSEDLERFLSNKPIKARPVSMWERSVKWVGRHPTVASLFVVLLLVVVGAFIGLSLMLIETHAALKKSRLATQKESQAKLQAKLEKHIAQKHRKIAEEAKLVAEKASEESLTQQQHVGLTLTQQFLRSGLYDEASNALLRVPYRKRKWEWYRLAQELQDAPKKVRFFGCHQWGVVDLCLHPNGRYLASSGQDGRVLVWDLTNGKKTVVQQGSWSSQRLAWKHALVRMPNEENAPRPECYPALWWAENGEVLYAVSLSGQVIRWNNWSKDSISREPVLKLDMPLYSGIGSPDDHFFLVGGVKGTLTLYEVGKRQATKVQLPSQSSILHLAAFRKGWLVGQENGDLSVLDERARIRTSSRLPGPIRSVAVSPDYQWLAVACGVPQLYTFSLHAADYSLQPRERYPVSHDGQHIPNALHSVAINETGKRIYAGDDLGRLIAWNKHQLEPLFVQMDQLGKALPSEKMRKLPLPLQKQVSAISCVGENSCITGGQNTLLWSWSYSHTQSTHSFLVGKRPCVCFDDTDDRWLWVGAKDGTISLIDSRTGKSQATVPAHNGPITGIDCARKARRVVTCSQDGTVCFWKRLGKEIVRSQVKLAFDHPLQDVSIDTEGTTVAVYDDKNQVSLWNVDAITYTRKESLGTGSLAANGGLVAFEPSGKYVAATGCDQVFRIIPLDASKPVFRHDNSLVCGQGGTAIVWDPARPGIVYGADSNGAVRANSSVWQGLPLTPGYRNQSCVGGLTVSPDGSRLVVARRYGNMEVLNPLQGHSCYTLRHTHAHPVTDVCFDSDGDRLAVIHKDGTIMIYHALVPRSMSLTDASGNWDAQCIKTSSFANHGPHSPQHVHMDEEGSVYYLRTEQVEKNEGQTKDSWRLFLGRNTKNKSSELCLGEAEADLRWHALRVSNDNLWVAYHRKRAGAKGITFLQQFHKRTIAQTNSSQPSALFPQPRNWGFRCQMLFGNCTVPSLLHYSFDGYYLWHTQQNQSIWRSQRVAHQGEGHAFQATEGNDGTVHLLFNTNRFTNDRYPPCYIRATMSPWKVLHREVIDSHASDQVRSLTCDSQGRPVIMSFRNVAPGNWQVIVFRRDSGKWKKLCTFPLNYSKTPIVSNLICDQHNNYYVSVFLPEKRTIALLAWKDGEAHPELILNEDTSKKMFTQQGGSCSLVTCLGRDGLPVVVVSSQQMDGWKLWILQRRNKL